MPKIKTRKTAAKRFKVTGTGKLIHQHAYRNHLNIHKGPGDVSPPGRREPALQGQA